MEPIPYAAARYVVSTTNTNTASDSTGDDTSAEDIRDTPVDLNIDHDAAKAYWSDISADVDGMLGGYPQVSRIDLQSSRAFLAKVGISASAAVKKAAAGGENGDGERAEKKRKLRNGDIGGGSTAIEALEKREGGIERKEARKPVKAIKRAVDCGAGIGRITTGLLLSLAETVDVVEPIAKFTDQLKDVDGVGRVFNVGLEAWDPTANGEESEDKYDLIWNQWCLGHLTDDQLVGFLKKCALAIGPGGIIVVKENLALGDLDVFDRVDNSVTRTDAKFRDIFQRADLRIRKTELQKGFPSHLFPVRMYALIGSLGARH